MTDLPAPSCPACGRAHLHWELHRLPTRGAALTSKTIRWECRQCGHTWLVPTRPEARPAPPPAG